jgi:hypothetical protein
MKAAGFMILGGRIVTVHRKLGKEAEKELQEDLDGGQLFF